MEEVKSNFFSYLGDMVNYKITTCYHMLFDINNYQNNFGLYIGAILLNTIIIIYFFYLLVGRKSLRKKYFAKKPNWSEIKEIESKFNKSNLNTNTNKGKKNEIASSLTVNNYTNKKSNPNKKNKDIIIKRITKKRKKGKKKKARNIQLKKNGEILSFSSKGYISSNDANYFLDNSKNIIKTIYEKKKTKEEEKIDYDELYYNEAFIKDKRNFFEMFKSLFFLKLQTIQIFFYPKEFTHISLTLSLYLFDILLDFTINSLLFSDQILSQKYFNNGDLLFITTNILSISSNVISFFILLYLGKLIDRYQVFDIITKEFKSEDNFLKIFKILKCYFEINVTIFFLILFLIGLFCTYYLFIFFSIYKNIQGDLFVNYIVGSLWSLGFTTFICLFVAITRRIAILKKVKRLFILSKYIDDTF
jgi:hypothetical protein